MTVVAWFSSNASGSVVAPLFISALPLESKANFKTQMFHKLLTHSLYHVSGTDCLIIFLHLERLSN